MSSSGWHEMAEAWDARMGDEGDLWHRALIDPPLLRLVGKVNGLRLLDLACGNGYLSRRFALQGAIVTGVDTNMPLIQRIRAQEEQESLGITYHIGDASNLEMLADSSFDIVVCNMALMDIEDVTTAVQEISRVLVPKGRFIASPSHPCFDKLDTSGWDIEHIYPRTTVWRKMSRYREVAVSDLSWPQASGELIYTRAYHRPLSWYFRTLRAANLVVAALEEPEPTEEFLENSQQGSWITEIPLHCVLEAWKVSGLSPLQE